ncbi:thiamine pyrophosphate-binding protein [Specibacter cremeus]|uniref:thiamine pyrophosphate-binding protein n=1 Tax=Specibacter cremeus TaxID=1629051 RepID=UPI000F77E305|nr:thiamine pyrophosphate-binding protein [Specibacter cremeus]
MNADRPAATSHPTVSDVVADVCAAHTGMVFGLMGNGNAFFISNLTRRGVDYISARHEAGTVAMADAYHRASGRVAVATTTYGAGFTNALTPLAEAVRARIPMVLVVGDAPTTGPRPWDIDQAMVAAGLGVPMLTVGAATASRVTEDAWATAVRDLTPVIVAIPYDLASEPAAAQEADVSGPPAAVVPVNDDDVARVARLVAAARRPLIVAGRGAVLADAGPALRSVGDKLGALFATSVMARNVFDSAWDLGVAGGFARRAPIELMRRADVLLVVGASLNTFQARYGSLFGEATTVIQVDALPAATNARVDEFVCADAGTFARALDAALGSAGGATWRDRHPEVADGTLHRDLPADEFAADGRLNPIAVAERLDGVLPANRTIVQDGGHFIGWAPGYCTAPDPRAMMLVGTAYQTIGLGLPAAVGAAAARPDRTTVLVSGDGGALMALADLDTAVHNIASGIVIVFNDAAYGAELHQYAARGLDEKAMLIQEADFAALGRALGADGVKVRALADLEVLRRWVADGARGLFVLDVAVSPLIVADYMRESMAGILAAQT